MAKVIMKQAPMVLFISAILLLSSCSAVPNSWPGAKSGKIDTQATSATHNYALKWVDEALVAVLDQMEVIVIETTPSPDGKSFKAATLDQDIVIELKSVTPSSTRMQIDIKVTENEERASIGDEIMVQTEKLLLENSQIDTANFAEGLPLNKEQIPAK
jgi:hypothetical protein